MTANRHAVATDLLIKEICDFMGLRAGQDKLSHAGCRVLGSRTIGLPGMNATGLALDA